jgi:hypothetical protein
MDWTQGGMTDTPAPETDDNEIAVFGQDEPITTFDDNDDEPVQLDTRADFEYAVITSLNAVHDRLDAIGAQNDWLVTAVQRTHDGVAWIRTTFEQLSAGLLASPMGAMIRSKLPNMEK